MVLLGFNWIGLNGLGMKHSRDPPMNYSNMIIANINSVMCVFYSSSSSLSRCGYFYLTITSQFLLIPHTSLALLSKLTLIAFKPFSLYLSTSFIQRYELRFCRKKSLIILYYWLLGDTRSVEHQMTLAMSLSLITLCPLRFVSLNPPLST